MPKTRLTFASLSLSNFIIIVNFSAALSPESAHANPSTYRLATKSSSCLDALFMEYEMLFPLDEESMKVREVVDSWKKKFQVAQPEDFARAKSHGGLLADLVPECSTGLTALVQHLGEKKWVDGLLAKWIRQSESVRPIESRVRLQLAGSLIALSFLQRHGFEKEWNAKFERAAKSVEKSVIEWQASNNGRRALEMMGPLICDTDRTCLDSHILWASGLEDVAPRNLLNGSWMFGPSARDDIGPTLVHALVSMYHSNVKLRPRPESAEGIEQEYRTNPEYVAFRNHYRMVQSYDEFSANALEVAYLYSIKEFSYLSGLKFFRAPALDPVGGRLYIQLRGDLDKRVSITRDELDAYFLNFEKSGYPLDLASFRKIIEPVSGALGITSDASTDGLRILSVSPGFAKSLLKGDTIVEIDGANLAGKTLYLMKDLLNGPPGATKKLKVRRNKEILNLEVTLKSFD